MKGNLEDAGDEIHRAHTKGVGTETRICPKEERNPPVFT